MDCLTCSIYEGKWDDISKHQYLSYDFIDKHKEKLKWKLVSRYQKLSEEQIYKYFEIIIYHKIL